jgi:glycine/D-amino acid oxidase-like deaminating enzyme/nitrite reductase/ring-hydroxylating ferredoxin subunit
MMHDTGSRGGHTPLWMDARIEPLSVLSADISVDIAIIGGGLTGLNTALLLSEAGARVAIIEGKRIGTGVSGHTTAKITSQHGLIYEHLLSAMGSDAAFSYAQANQAALARYSELISANHISCDFTRKEAFTYTPQTQSLGAIQKEVDAAQRIGIPARLVTDLDLPFPAVAAISFPDQAQFHPRKYMAAVVRMLHQRQVPIYEQTWVEDVSDGSPVLVKTSRGTVSADAVILANHSPSPYSVLFFTRMTPKRSYVVAVESKEPLPPGMYYSSETPYTSLRTCSDGENEFLLVGGQNHKTGYHESAVERYRNLEAFARVYFQASSVHSSWSTQDNVTMDRVPYIGKVPVTKNVYLAIGFGGWGMTHSMVSAMLLTDMLSGRINDWKLLYDPARIKLSGAGDAIQQNLDYMKHMVKDHLPLKGAVSPDGLQPGHGAVGKFEGKTMAMARDSSGRLHGVSASCSHMGCGVVFNDAEQSWDCPCHGSRFGLDGQVLHGPAADPLKDELTAPGPSQEP